MELTVLDRYRHLKNTMNINLSKLNYNMNKGH